MKGCYGAWLQLILLYNPISEGGGGSLLLSPPDRAFASASWAWILRLLLLRALNFSCNPWSTRALFNSCAFSNSASSSSCCFLSWSMLPNRSSWEGGGASSDKAAGLGAAALSAPASASPGGCSPSGGSSPSPDGGASVGTPSLSSGSGAWSSPSSLATSPGLAISASSAATLSSTASSSLFTSSYRKKHNFVL